MASLREWIRRLWGTLRPKQDALPLFREMQDALGSADWIAAIRDRANARALFLV